MSRDVKAVVSLTQDLGIGCNSGCGSFEENWIGQGCACIAAAGTYVAGNGEGSGSLDVGQVATRTLSWAVETSSDQLGSGDGQQTHCPRPDIVWLAWTSPR